MKEKETNLQICAIKKFGKQDYLILSWSGEYKFCEIFFSYKEGIKNIGVGEKWEAFLKEKNNLYYQYSWVTGRKKQQKEIFLKKRWKTTTVIFFKLWKGIRSQKTKNWLADLWKKLLITKKEERNCLELFFLLQVARLNGQCLNLESCIFCRKKTNLIFGNLDLGGVICAVCETENRVNKEKIAEKSRFFIEKEKNLNKETATECWIRLIQIFLAERGGLTFEDWNLF